MSQSSVFLPRASLWRRFAPWGQAGLWLALVSAVLLSTAALAALVSPQTADERGLPEVIELAALETTTQSEAQDAATDAPEQLEESRREIDEVKSAEQQDERPQEQASPEQAEEDLRLAQEKTRETQTTAEPVQQATERQERKDVPAPTSQASVAAEQSEAIDGKPENTTATAPDVGADREGQRRMQEWQKKLYSHIGRNKFYPAAARTQRQKGEVVVAFTLDAEGRIGDIRLVRSSGSTALDEAAMETMHKSNPAPKPPFMVNEVLNLELPMRFALK